MPPAVPQPTTMPEPEHKEPAPLPKVVTNLRRPAPAAALKRAVTVTDSGEGVRSGWPSPSKTVSRQRSNASLGFDYEPMARPESGASDRWLQTATAMPVGRPTLSEFPASPRRSESGKAKISVDEERPTMLDRDESTATFDTALQTPTRYKDDAGYNPYRWSNTDLISSHSPPGEQGHESELVGHGEGGPYQAHETGVDADAVEALQVPQPSLQRSTSTASSVGRHGRPMTGNLRISHPHGHRRAGAAAVARSSLSECI